MKLDKIRTGLIFGVFAFAGHTIWSSLVYSGFAQTILDKVFENHFLNNPFNVLSFDLTKAVMLVASGFIASFVAGWLFAYIWNQLVKK